MSRRSCDFSEELLSAYLDDEVTEADRIQVERHIAGCDACRRRLDELRKVSGLLSQMPREKPSSSFRRRLRESITDGSSKRSRSGSKGFLSDLPIGRPLVAAAVIILIVVLPLAALLTGTQLAGPMVSDEAPLPEALTQDAEEAQIRTEAEDEEPADPSDEEPAEPEYSVGFAARGEQETFATIHVAVELEAGDLTAARRRLLQLAKEQDLAVQKETLRESADLQEYLVVLRAPAASDDLRDEIEALGVLSHYQVQHEFYPHLPLSMEVFEDPEKEAVISERHLEVKITRSPSPEFDFDSLPNDRFWPMIYSALNSSWHRFGAHVAGAVLWIAAHAVHVLFAVLVVLGAFIFYRTR